MIIKKTTIQVSLKCILKRNSNVNNINAWQHSIHSVQKRYSILQHWFSILHNKNASTCMWLLVTSVFLMSFKIQSKEQLEKKPLHIHVKRDIWSYSSSINLPLSDNWLICCCWLVVTVLSKQRTHLYRLQLHWHCLFLWKAGNRELYVECSIQV